MTKAAFLAEYRRRLIAGRSWAQNEAELNKFMGHVHRTITTDKAPWNYDSQLARDAFAAIGGRRSTYTRKALRALPDGELS